jgi:hypothetical protein
MASHQPSFFSPSASPSKPFHFLSKTNSQKFPCSTSRFGIGQNEGSNRTPLGLHRIAEKIGAGLMAVIFHLHHCAFAGK